MDDSLLNDVTSLLDGDFGDDRILKQISQACKNNELISNYERDYVQKLAEQYLDKKSEITHSEISENTFSTNPDTVIPTIEPSTQAQIYQSKPPRNSNFSLKNPKLILGFGGIILVIIIAAVILSSSNSDSFSSNTVSNLNLKFFIETDLSSYSQKDIISINGISINSDIVNISIENQNNKLVWAEQVSVKNNGMYSTLVIAGGSGWENSGTYTMKVDNGSEIKLIKFSFTS